jgi:hypothetical protein
MPKETENRMNQRKLTGAGVARVATGGLAGAVEAMLPEIRGLIEAARHRSVTATNLWDIRRFHQASQMRQPVAGELGDLAPESWRLEIPQPVAVESQTRPAPGLPSKRATRKIRQPLAAESVRRLQTDLSRHRHLNWSHCQTLPGFGHGRQGQLYFEPACAERWSRRLRN